MSIKKLLEGEGIWETRMEILGWVFDGITRCIKLPMENIKQINEATMLALQRKGIWWKE